MTTTMEKPPTTHNNNMGDISRLSTLTHQYANDFVSKPHVSPSIGNNLIEGILNSFIPAAQAQEENDLEQDFDSSHKYYHYYELHNNICSTKNPECTEDNVYQELKKFPAPGWDGSGTVKNGDVSEIGFAGMGGKVKHIVDDSNHRVVNVTLPGHIFEHGTVDRLVVKDDQNIKIKTVGEGVNESAIQTWLNMETYREGFQPFVEGFADLDANIKSNFEGKFGK